MLNLKLGDETIVEVDRQIFLERSYVARELLEGNELNCLVVKEIPNLRRLKTLLFDTCDDNIDVLINKANDAYYLGYHSVLYDCTIKLGHLFDSGVNATIKRLVDGLNPYLYELINVDAQFFVERCIEHGVEYPMPSHIEFVIANSLGSSIYKTFAREMWNGQCKRKGLI